MPGGPTCSRATRERHTAFAVEGIADEVVFVTGPALVTLLATSFAPQSGLVVALVAGTVGTVALAANAGPSHPPTRATGRWRGRRCRGACWSR